MEVIGDFDKAVSVSSGKSNIGIHFRKNERGLETVNIVISLEQFCYKVEERNGSVIGRSGGVFSFCFCFSFKMGQACSHAERKQKVYVTGRMEKLLEQYHW